MLALAADIRICSGFLSAFITEILFPLCPSLVVINFRSIPSPSDFLASAIPICKRLGGGLVLIAVIYEVAEFPLGSPSI